MNRTGCRFSHCKSSFIQFLLPEGYCLTDFGCRSSCANLTWELLYGLIYSPGWAEFVVFFPGFLVDICLVYVTLKFGPREWQQSPLVAANLGIVMTVGTLMTLAAHLAALDLFTDYTEASFWSAYVCQTTLSWYSIAQLLSRGSTKGHSMAIW